MRDEFVAMTFATKDAAPQVPGAGIPTEVTLGAIATAAVVWGGAFIRGKLKEDAAEKIELAAAVKRSDSALADLTKVVGTLQVDVAKCETHREHDAKERERLLEQIQEVKRRQVERIDREHDHE